MPLGKGLDTLPLWAAPAAVFAVAGVALLSNVLSLPLLAVFIGLTVATLLVLWRGELRPGMAGRAWRVLQAPGDAALPGTSGMPHFVAPEFHAAQAGREVALVMFEFACFDDFAEQAGPAGTAEAVREFARILKASARALHQPVRTGWRGDSFLAVLPGADGVQAAAYVARVRSDVAASRVALPCVRVGTATWDATLPSPEAFVAAAERELGVARMADGAVAVSPASAYLRPYPTRAQRARRVAVTA